MIELYNSTLLRIWKNTWNKIKLRTAKHSMHGFFSTFICNHLAGATKHTTSWDHLEQVHEDLLHQPLVPESERVVRTAQKQTATQFWHVDVSRHMPPAISFSNSPAFPPLVLAREGPVTNLRVACFCPRRMLWGPTPLCLVCLAQIVRLPRDVPSTT